MLIPPRKFLKSWDFAILYLISIGAGVEKPACLIIRLVFGFASDFDSVCDKLNQSTNTEAAMLSILNDY